MVVLKKIQSATLVETLVASVIILVVFLIASMSLNNVFKTTIKENDSALKSRIKELHYLNRNHQIIIPFYEETDLWEIKIEKQQGATLLFSESKLNNKVKETKIGYED
ncbi:MAG: hypothetical protein COB12_06735 [Flavobacterium sp.]|nr:MAG: hypothetical protein COB12_06735 [Flavobacterium sp.]